MDFTQPQFQEGIAIEQPELNTGLSEDELNNIIDSRINESKTAYETLKVDDRRKLNLDYYLGKQYDEANMVSGIPYVDNVIYQDTEHRINLATGRMPDLIVTPGDGSLKGRQLSKKIENVLDIDISTKEKKRLVKNGLRHNHLFYIGVLKACWNPNKGMFGDYEFNLRDPRKVLIAHNGTIPEDGFTADNCDLIIEIVEEPVATIMAKFPNKRQELLSRMSLMPAGRLVTSIKYQEIWYTYHNRQGQIVEGVCWRYNGVILRNIRNPYFDFTGYDRVIFDDNGQPTYNQLGQVQTEHVFRNFFERPRKPYIFFSYQNLGNTPLDDTTAVEQSIPLQRNLNKTGKQIRDISDGITSKIVFAGGSSGISQDQARSMTLNPKEPIWLAGAEDVGKAVSSFTNRGPEISLFNEMIQTRQQIDAKFNTHGTIRGETNTAESGVSKQITREGDLVASDDIVEIVVERVLEEMASWALQFMKLMYVHPHFKSKMGKDGDVIQELIQRDDIDDGVAITVHSSTVDKNTARDLAVKLGEAGAIDPLTMFEEMDVPNPRERARRLLLFKMGEGEMGDGFSRYMEEIGLDDLVQQQPQIPQTPPATPNQPMPPTAGESVDPAMLQAMTARMV